MIEAIADVVWTLLVLGVVAYTGMRIAHAISERR